MLSIIICLGWNSRFISWFWFSHCLRESITQWSPTYFRQLQMYSISCCLQHKEGILWVCDYLSKIWQMLRSELINSRCYLCCWKLNLSKKSFLLLITISQNERQKRKVELTEFHPSIVYKQIKRSNWGVLDMSLIHSQLVWWCVNMFNYAKWELDI